MTVISASRELLAIHGGSPVRDALLPYGHQSISESDIQAVVETLRSDWLTTGPKVDEFEEAMAAWVGTKHAVSFSFWHCRTHAAAFAAGLKLETRRSPPDDLRSHRQLRAVPGSNTGFCGCLFRIR